MSRVRTALLVVLLLTPAGATARQPAAETVPAPARPRDVDARPVTAPAADVGYALGYRIGGRIVADHEGMGLDIDRDALARGLADAVAGGKPALDEARLSKALEAFEALVAARQAAVAERMRKAGEVNLVKGREFLAANARRPGVVTRPSGLQYEIVKEGAGPSPAAGDVVVAHYRGTRLDGGEFDATDPAGEPATFPLGAVVPGWQEALPLMKAGATWKLWIPADLAYGAEGSPPVIEPNEVLVFEIQLIRSGPAAGRP